jgi:hypothetical protein
VRRGSRAAGRVAGTLLVLLVGGCGRSGFDVVLPSAGVIQLVLPPSADWQYERFEICWHGELVAADPAADSGAVATVATYPEAPAPAGGTALITEESEELRAGTWRLRYRVTGLTTGAPGVTLLDVEECANYDGLPPQVTASARTVVMLRHDIPGQCNWYLTGQSLTPNTGAVVAQACTP